MTTMSERRATMHNATACKHDSVPGELWVAVIYEGRRILDTHEGESAVEVSSWARDAYGLTAEVA